MNDNRNQCLEPAWGGRISQKQPKKRELDVGSSKSARPNSSKELYLQIIRERVKEPVTSPKISDQIARIIKNEDVEVIGKVGSGSFGTVYEGIWHGQRVAIKRINEATGTSGINPSQPKQPREAISHEAMILSRLRHPNVVLYHGVILDGPEGTPATVTRYVKDGTLRDVLLDKTMNISRREKLSIALGVAKGMEYLHSKNVVHFDLKSSNLFVDMTYPRNPKCVIGDLGLSITISGYEASSRMRGSIPWMAPELLKGERATKKVDVYSFGIVLWEILTGEVPYAGVKVEKIIEGVVDNKLRPPVPSSCEPEWRKLMESCWHANDWKRPSFEQIVTSLSWLGSLRFDEDKDMHGDICNEPGSSVGSSNRDGTSKSCNLYGIGPSICGSENMKCDHKHGESGIYGIITSINADEQGRNNQAGLFNKATHESVSDIYKVGASVTVDEQARSKKTTDVSECDVYKPEASIVSNVDIRNEEVERYAKESISDIYQIEATMLSMSSVGLH